jgi:hypothetical protein
MLVNRQVTSVTLILLTLSVCATATAQVRGSTGAVLNGEAAKITLMLAG